MTEILPGVAACADTDNTIQNSKIKPETGALESFLSESGLSCDDVPGWKHVTNAELNIALGRTGAARVAGSAIEIPYFDMNGDPIVDRDQPFRRFRLLSPTAGGPKYLSRAGSVAHVYVPQGLKKLIAMDDRLPEDVVENDRLLVICEGEKKAERLIKLGIPTVAIAGVHMWSDSETRESEKAKSELAGEKAPRLTRKSPVARDLVEIIRALAITKIVIVFDSDGRPVDPGLPGVTERFKSLPDGKMCLNPAVFWAGVTFSAALMRSCPGVAAIAGFTPHSVDKNGNFGRQGIDDWSLSADKTDIEAFIKDLAGRARAMSASQIEAEEDRAEKAARREKIEAEQGFVPLGYSSSGEGTTYYVWSKHLEVVKHFTSSSLTRKPDFYGSFGIEYCDEILGKAVVIQKEDEKKGIPEIVENRFDLDLGQRVVTSACQRAGRWSPDASVRGAGVWRDTETGGLIINNSDCIKLIKLNGDVEKIDRVRGRHIYESTDRGGWSDEIASIDDVRKIIETVESAWAWRTEAEGVLFAGWLFAQAYTGALKARPGVMLNGESGCGKSYLEEWCKRFIGPWGVRIEETRGTSLAGISQLIKRDSVTLFLDEIEPKSGASIEEASRVNRVIDSIRQMLRAAYSRSDDAGSYGAVKGTAHQEAVAREVRVMALMASIAEHDVEQADRNRNLRLGLNRIADIGHPAPALPDSKIGLSIFRLMWGRWAKFNESVEQIEKLIDHREPRMRMTLAVPISALLTALDVDATSQIGSSVINMINAECGGDKAADDAPRDQDRALQRLLAAVIDVNGIKKSIADAVSAALAAGLGRAGRGAGGPDGDALRLTGLTARRNGDGTISLFVAAGHQGVEALGRQIGVPALAGLLRAVEGAEVAGNGRGADERVKLSEQKWRGVWVPTPLYFVGLVDQQEDNAAPEINQAAPY